MGIIEWSLGLVEYEKKHLEIGQGSHFALVRERAIYMETVV